MGKGKLNASFIYQLQLLYPWIEWFFTFVLLRILWMASPCSNPFVRFLFQKKTRLTFSQCQRRQYKLYSSGKPSNMTSERIAALLDLDFVFDPRANRRPTPTADAVGSSSSSSSRINPFGGSGSSSFDPASSGGKPDGVGAQFFI